MAVLGFITGIRFGKSADIVPLPVDGSNLWFK